MKKSKLISVKNLKVFTKDVVLVKGISFDLDHNKVLGIIGESGSGKSLTALSILNLNKYKGLNQEGEIFYNDELISHANIQDLIKNKISIIFQDPMSFLNPSMSCGDQINEALRIKNKNQVFDLIKKVKIENYEETYYKYPHELSGGQQQRIMIAMAIAKNPQLIIADEATSSLDSLIKKDIIDLLLELKKEKNLSLIVVSHNLNLISNISNHVLVMNKGLIVEQGSTNEIFNKPKNNYTQNLINFTQTISDTYAKEDTNLVFYNLKNIAISANPTNKILSSKVGSY